MSSETKKLNDIEILVSVMRTIGIICEDKLKEKMLRSDNIRERNIAKSLGWNHIYDNALELFKQDENECAIEYLLSSSSENRVSVIFMMHLFYIWCIDQNINIDKFVCTAQTVLRLNHNKRRILFLNGEKNSGHLFWINSMLPDEKFVGIIQNNSKFPYAHCLNKKIITMQMDTLNQSIIKEITRVTECNQSINILISENDVESIDLMPHLITSTDSVLEINTSGNEQFTSKLFHYTAKSSELIHRFNKLVPNKCVWEHYFTYYNNQDALAIANGEKNDNRIEMLMK